MKLIAFVYNLNCLLFAHFLLSFWRCIIIIFISLYRSPLFFYFHSSHWNKNLKKSYTRNACTNFPHHRHRGLSLKIKNLQGFTTLYGYNSLKLDFFPNDAPFWRGTSTLPKKKSDTKLEKKLLLHQSKAT